MPTPRKAVYWTCWNCESEVIRPRADIIADHPLAGIGNFICDDCGAAGDEEDFNG